MLDATLERRILLVARPRLGRRLLATVLEVRDRETAR
jgi:hypothetical protein